MTPNRAAIGHVVASFVVIAVIVVGGLAFVSSMNGSSRSTTGGFSQTTFYSGSSSQGLQLQIKLNASEILQGGALQAHILLVNALSQSVLLHPDFAANPNIDRWNWNDYLCRMSPVEHVFGFALFQGHYTAANLSQAGAPLTLTPPVAISCPNFAYGESYIQNVEFAPNSDMATFSANASSSADFKPQTIRMQMNATTGYCTESPYHVTETQMVGGTTTVTTGMEYSQNCGSNGVDSMTGYWSPYGSCTYAAGKGANGTAQGLYSSCFHQFTPGTYTIVAEDLWNQTVFGYFAILSSSTTATTYLGIFFVSPWHYVGNVTLSGSLSACEALRLPCPLNPTSQAEEFTDGTSVIYAEEMTGCGPPQGCITSTILVSNGSIACVTPKVPWASLCPSTIGILPTTTATNTYTSSATQEYAEVTGDVSVGPRYPICQEGKYCNVNMTGYAIGFTELRSSASDFETLTYNGSFSVEFTPGTYMVNLYYCKGSVFPTDCAPSCPWLGCSSFYVNNRTLESFPFPITVAGGQTIVLDISISTGIA